MTIRAEGNRLVAELWDATGIPLVSESNSIFVVPETGDAVEFIRNANGNITGASVENQGSLIWAKRLP